jgi:hypothetical protein
MNTMRGFSFTALLAASAVLAMLAITGFEMAEKTLRNDATIRIEPREQAVALGETMTVSVVVSSHVSINVFGGELTWDPAVLRVESIDYNTSIADLWAERPWYSNGEGSLTFGGGTTRAGGFNGSGKLITVTFKTIGVGNGSVVMRHAQLLKHDGLGTGVPLLEPIDALITVTSENTRGLGTESHIAVVTHTQATDLNGDGKQTFADVSILMLHLLGSDVRYDLNADGAVNTKDLEYLLTKK